MSAMAEWLRQFLSSVECGLERLPMGRQLTSTSCEPAPAKRANGVSYLKGRGHEGKGTYEYGEHEKDLSDAGGDAKGDASDDLTAAHDGHPNHVGYQVRY